MKKLILSAVFALACFSANAQTTTKVVEIPKKQEMQLKNTSETTAVVTIEARPASPMCYQTWTTTVICGYLSFTFTGMGLARNCVDALGYAMQDANDQAFEAVCPQP